MDRRLVVANAAAFQQRLALILESERERPRGKRAELESLECASSELFKDRRTGGNAE
jgi:hypothetical protein